MDEKKVKPCPFCGGTEFGFGTPFIAIQEDRMHIAHCKTCDMMFYPKALDWDEAIEAMNRRPE